MFKKILVSTDGSEYSKRAFGIALNFAETCGSELILLHVTFTPEALGYTLKIGNSALQDESLATGEMVLQATLGGFDTSKIALQVRQKPGHPAVSIIEEAQAENVELIIMGNHGYGPLTGSMLGSVSQKVLHRSPCPVLIVK